MLESFKVIALNHKATDVSNIGCFTASQDDQDSVTKDLHKIEGVEEVMYLSTCNRVEVWMHTNRSVSDQAIKEVLYNGCCFGQFFNLEKDFFQLEGELALLHMVNVSCSLDSMIVGEREIFGQLRRSFLKGNQIGSIGRNLNFVMRKITEISKEVYSKTQIANQKVSVASIACHELRKFIELPEETALSLIGAGETIQLVSKYLKNHSFKSIQGYNRTLSNLIAVQEILPDIITNILDGNTINLEQSDLIITCTGSINPIITKASFLRDRSYVVLDLAVPSDCTDEVKQLSQVKYIGVEELKEISKNNIKERLKDLAAASDIAHKGWEELILFLKERSALDQNQEVFTSIKTLFKDKVLHKEMSLLNGKEKQDFEKILGYMEKKLTQIPALLSKKILIE